jgi:hypothetical protein
MMKHEFSFPNIHLFAFYQKEITKGITTINGSNASFDSADWLWSKCDEIILKRLGKNFNLKDLLNLEQLDDITHIPLAFQQKENIKDRRTYLELINTNTSIYDNAYSYILDNKIYFDANNFVYPVRSYDSYGLGISLCYSPNIQYKDSQKLSAQQLNKLNPGNSFILEKENDKFLGQTLLITVSLPSKDEEQTPEALKNLADDYLQAFFPNDYRIPPFNQAGDLFGYPIFEYGIFRQLSTYRHILVWFLPDESKFEACYKEFFDLFCFRAEVVNAYQKSCNDDKKLTEKKYQEIEKQIEKTLNLGSNTGLNQNELKEFNKQIVALLKMSMEYADCLRDIEDNQNKIVVKNRYYTEKLREIKSIFPKENLSFLESFSTNTSHYFQEQVTMELEYFRHGFGLIDKAIASIRGQVAIDLAEAERQRDRKEQRDNLAIVSGFGTAGIIASVLQIENDKTDPLKTNPLMKSVSPGVLVGLLVWLISWLWSRYPIRKS